MGSGVGDGCGVSLGFGVADGFGVGEGVGVGVNVGDGVGVGVNEITGVTETVGVGTLQVLGGLFDGGVSLHILTAETAHWYVLFLSSGNPNDVSGALTVPVLTVSPEVVSLTTM